MASSTPEQAQAGMDAWMKWAEKCGDAIVDLGSPLGTAKRVTPGGVSDSPSQAGGFSVLQGDSIDDVTALLADHPHFMTPGDPSIDVSEYLPIPGM
jgi:hypothetical protein